MTPLDTDERGATAVEYAIMAAAIAAVVVAIVFVLGQQTCSHYQATTETFRAARGAAGDPVTGCG